MADECRRDLAAYAPARRLYEKLLAEYPDSTQGMRATRGIVNIDIKTGNYAAAEAGVQTLLTKYANHPDLPKAFYYLGNDYLDARHNAEVAECYQYTIGNRPDTTEEMLSWAGLGRVHIRNGDDQAARDVIDIMVADFNDHPDLVGEVFRVGEEYYIRAFRARRARDAADTVANFKKCVAIWSRIIEELPVSLPHTAHAYYSSASAYRHLGEYAKAVEHYNKVVTDWPNYEYAWLALLRTAHTYDHLRRSGALPQVEANDKIQGVYERILAEYPESSAASDAHRWFNSRYRQLDSRTNEGDRK